jgi:2-C-methyl-D-erythritol 4-phosphate cytidylyltransferase
MIIGIILAAGTSSRFKSDTPKQLYSINNKPIIEYSIDTMINLVDILIIVINKNIILPFLNTSKIVVLENNMNQRKASLNIAIKYIQDTFQNTEKVLIHDSARPYITQSYFEELLKSTSKYTQYVIKLTNGLYNIETNSPVNRDSYIELCTPICISFDILKIQETDEIIDSIDRKPDFIYGHYNILKKITTIEDV